MDEFLGVVKKYLGNGRWMWVLGGAALIVAIAIPVALLWPTIQPKPEPTYMAVPSSAQATSSSEPALLPAVPKDVMEQIAGKLGVTTFATLSMSYQGDTEHVAVTRAMGAAEFKRYMFVKGEDGTWSKQ